MKKLMLLFLLSGSCLFSQAQSVDDIVKKIYESSGGWDKWSAVKSIRLKGNFLMGPGALAPVMNLICSSPCQCSRDEFSWGGMTQISAFQTDSGWTYNPFGGKRSSDPMNEEQIRSARLSSDPQGLLFNYKAKGYQLEYLGMDDFEGVDVHRLRLINKSGDMVYYDIDAQSGLILRLVSKIKLADKEVRSETVYSNYQKSAYGIFLPMSIEFRGADGSNGGIIKYDEAIVNGTVDLNEFSRPAEKEAVETEKQ